MRTLKTVAEVRTALEAAKQVRAKTTYKTHPGFVRVAKKAAVEYLADYTGQETKLEVGCHPANLANYDSDRKILYLGGYPLGSD